MTQPRKIVAAVDLSEFSVGIVRYSGWLALQIDAELVVVNVINQRDLDMVHRVMIGYESFSFPDYLEDQEKTRAAQVDDLIAANCPEGVNCRTLIRTGIPYRELLATVETEKAQLMVVGTKGRGNLADALVGSQARKLYRRSPIPLLTIPAAFNVLP
ncbi:universal stress protein [uncultured Desulfosarcina sp.]|uniref:universal stress protein n=1 Tax=uncultured Desulfosarcina sp. TaxID=218289 RepID=UPI0029C8D4F0|nr:universal stress protein [uncultured Desulfosarcina sp.]